jgi:plastocyanin
MVPSGTRRWTALAMILAVALTAAALPAVGGRPVRAQAEVTVEIVDFAFEPGTIEVPLGTTVTWVNQGQAPHTATSDDLAFDSGLIDPGGTFSIIFDVPGTFAYHCDLHPDMVATIVVVEGQPVEEPTAPPVDEPIPTVPPVEEPDPSGFAPVEQVAPVAVPHLAHIHAGACDELGIVVFAFADVRSYALTGAAAGGGDVQVLVGTARVELPELFTEPFSIHVHKSEAEKSVYIACAEIGGPPAPPWQPSDGFAVPMVEQQDSGESGIAALKPDSGGATTVTLLLAGGAAATGPVVEETPPPDGEETPPPDGEETPAASTPGNYVSPTFGYTLSYGQAWTVEEETSSERQDRLVLTNGTSFVTFVAAAGFGGDTEQCVTGFAEETLVDPAVDNVELATDAEGNPVQGGTPATGAFAAYNHTYAFADGRVEPYTLFVGCIPLVPDEAVLAVIQNVPTAAYNEQVEAREGLLRGLTLPQQ